MSMIGLSMPSTRSRTGTESPPVGLERREGERRGVRRNRERVGGRLLAPDQQRCLLDGRTKGAHGTVTFTFEPDRSFWRPRRADLRRDRHRQPVGAQGDGPARHLRREQVDAGRQVGRIGLRWRQRRIGDHELERAGAGRRERRDHVLDAEPRVESATPVTAPRLVPVDRDRVARQRGRGRSAGGIDGVSAAEGRRQPRDADMLRRRTGRAETAVASGWISTTEPGTDRSAGSRPSAPSRARPSPRG